MHLPHPPSCPPRVCSFAVLPRTAVSLLSFSFARSLAPFSPLPSSPLSSSAITKSCCLFLRRDWQLYSRRMLVYCTRTHIHEYTYIYIYMYTYTRTVCARIVYALCMKPNKYKRATRRARMVRESEKRTRRAVGGGRRVTGEILREIVCVWKKELELKLSQLNVRSRARVGSQ